MKLKTWVVLGVVAVAGAAGGYVYWQQQLAAQLPAGIVSSNGRIEAEQVNISSKLAGRVAEVLVDQGDMVDAGQIVARMDAGEINAQVRRAQAEIRRAEKAKLEASASVIRVRSHLTFAEAELARVQTLHRKGFATTEKLDQRHNELQAADANYRAAVAGVEQADEAITSAKEDLARLTSILDDTTLKAPQRGRIQYRLAEPGEVVAAGGNILTLLDIADVYMTVFLPASDAGLISLGSDARIILDPIPQYVIPARVSFVAAQAQFTPKAVETAQERAKLMFRVKLTVDPKVLRKHEDRVKTGVRGLAYLRLPQAQEWPENLTVKLPE